MCKIFIYYIQTKIRIIVGIKIKNENNDFRHKRVTRVEY